MKNRIAVTGGAGFIGSHLVDRLLAGGNDVTVIDNLTSGKMEFLKHHLGDPKFKFIEMDLLESGKLTQALEGIDSVYHLAANPDVRSGALNTRIYLEQNIIVTYNVLEAMRILGIKNMIFTSTSTIYGEATLIPTPENYGPLIPISVYGASKLACEALITSFCSTFEMNSWIFRFANIVGSRGTHGIIFDFINKLKNDPASLEILGDGKQEKSYLHISECVTAIFFAVKNSNETVNIFNIGSKDTINATEIGEIIVEEMGLKNVGFRFTGGKRGWKGDVPMMMLSIDKIRELGWEPACGSRESVVRAARSLLKDE